MYGVSETKWACFVTRIFKSNRLDCLSKEGENVVVWIHLVKRRKLFFIPFNNLACAWCREKIIFNCLHHSRSPWSYEWPKVIWLGWA